MYKMDVMKIEDENKNLYCCIKFELSYNERKYLVYIKLKDLFCVI